MDGGAYYFIPPAFDKVIICNLALTNKFLLLKFEPKF